MEFLSYCTEEDNYFVWSKVSAILSELVEVFAGNDAKLEELKILARRLFSKTADRLGWDCKPVDCKYNFRNILSCHKSINSKNIVLFSADLDILLRSLAVRKMVEFEDPEYLKEGKRRFQAFEDCQYDIPADLRVGIYKAHLFGSGIEAVHNLLKVLG